jgi:hypothetical protein
VTERALDMSPLGFVPAPKAGILLKEILKLKIEGCRFGNYSIGSDLFLTIHINVEKESGA